MLYLLVFIVTFLATLSIRHIAIKKELLDHPNARSSHQTPTPKGGGLAIMLTFYSVLFYLFFQNTLQAPLFYALLSALPVVVISLIDDIYPLSAKIRFGVQFLSAAAALYFLGGVNTLNFVSFTLHGVWLNLIAIIGIVWITNLYNFLDGIDGYAASEALFIGVAAYALFGNTIALYLAIASAGFLILNWDKASIFMGDVGSAPLGFIFAVFITAHSSTPDFLAWLMLLSLFWFDATLTLIRRARNREKLSQAHKKHIYQRLTQAGFRHGRVVLFAMGINLTIFILLYLIPTDFHLYLSISIIVMLYLLTKVVDRLKAFE